MNSGINILKVLLLISLLQPFLLKAHAELSGFKSGISYFEPVKENSGSSEINFSGKPVEHYFAAPILSLTVVPYQGKIAQLSWTTSDTSLSGTYNVERLDASGWAVIKQMPFNALLQYNDTISYPYCKATNIDYRIRFLTASDTTASSTESALLSDQTSAADVSDLNVDLLFGKGGFGPQISWHRITNDSILRYFIQRFDGFSWILKDSVSADSNIYFDKSASPVCESSFKYVVLAYDKCRNSSDVRLYDDYAVQTIKLDVIMPGQCDQTATLTWNPNIHLPGGLSGYKIYRNNAGISELLKDTLATSFVDNSGLINGSTYGYSVTAYSNNSAYTSSSCELFQQYIGVTEPDSIYITQVSVEDDSYNRISYYFSPEGSVQKLILLRSDDRGATPYHAIDTIISPVPQQFYFNDTTADVHAQVYRYWLQAVDACGKISGAINSSQNIYLQCTSSETQNTLSWETYEYWLQDIEKYTVSRILNNEAATIIGSVGNAVISYTDLLSNYDKSKMACYRVEAKENPGNPYLQNAISKSNTCCILKEPVLYLPNAFSPGGTNKLFRPVPEFLYVDKQTFAMTIFSRWGEQLFETTNIDYGWDGTINGQDTPSGKYSYLIKYKSLEGKEYTKRGMVMLVR